MKSTLAFLIFLGLIASSFGQSAAANDLLLTMRRPDNNGNQTVRVPDPGEDAWLFWNESTDLWGSKALTDAIKDSWIDWGLAAGQVSAADIPIADAGGVFTGTDVEAALQEAAGMGGGGGSSVSVDGANVVNPNFTDGGDINFSASGSTITGTINAGAIVLADLAAAIQTSLGLADSSLQPGAIGVTLQGWKAVLDATTAAFTTADETKLDGIESGAQADLTGAEIKALYEAELNTNAYTDTDVAKVANLPGNTLAELAAKSDTGHTHLLDDVTNAGTAAGADIIDDDTMATATAANVPSAESAKAYVDTVAATKQPVDDDLTDLSDGELTGTKVGVMTGDAGAGGTQGAVPAPGVGTAAAGAYLKADGTWSVPPTGGGGSPVALDLADDGSNESTDLAEIAITNDTNSIFTEPAADKLLINLSQNWPAADLALTANAGDSATAFFSAGLLEHERGGLEADVSGYAGLLSITGGSTAQVSTLAGLNALISDATLGDASDFAAASHTHGTADIDDNAITNAKLANVASGTIKGRSTASTGDPEDLTATQVRTILNVENGATADQTPAELLAGIVTVDGAGSGLDADTLDGVDSASFATLSGTEALTGKTLNSFTNFVAADEVHQQVRNVSGVTIPKGSPVYINGYNAGQEIATVELADASTAATMPAKGLAGEDIATNTNGEIVMMGKLDGVDTSAWAVPTVLYVSETTGQLTDVAPTPDGTNQSQPIAVVVRQHATLGVLEVKEVGVLPSASETQSGIVELATLAEIDTGVEAENVITPAGLSGSALATKLAGIEAAATADQSDAEIETAYNNQVAAASQAEMEAGTEAAIRRMSPLRVAQAIASLGGGSGDVTAAAAFGTDNRLIRSDGTGKGVQASGVTLDDSNNLTGFNEIDATTANVGNLQFEGATADDFETVLAVTDPTADRTVTLPDATGLLVLSGAIAPSDLANQAAGSVLYWNAGGSPTLLAPGTDNQVLTMDGVDSVAWSTLDSPTPFIVAMSDMETSITADASTVVADFYAPFDMTLVYIAASAHVAPTGGDIIIDVHLGAGGAAGTSVMLTDKVEIEAGEYRSEDSLPQPDLTTTAVTDGQQLTARFDAVGATEGGKGIKLYIYYTR